VFGAWAAAWPAIRDELGLSYAAVGVLLALPQIFGNIIEPPLGLLADGSHRRTVVRAGGVAFALAFLLVAASDGFALLLLALMLASPASGAFVALSQAVLMDLEPRRREQNMARWALAGSLGMIAGPLILTAAGCAALGWRAVFASFAVLTLGLLALAWDLPLSNGRAGANPSGGRSSAERSTAGRSIAGRSAAREPTADLSTAVAMRRSVAGALRALRRPEPIRWLTLLQLGDLMFDVLHAFLALYFVDVVGTSDAGAAFAIILWTGAGLIGDVAVIHLLERVDGLRWVRFSATATLIVFPLFLLVEPVALRLVLLALLGLLSAGWYAVLQARLYASMPGRSGTVMALNSLFGIAGGVLPLAVGLVAQRAGLPVAMWLLAAGPVALLIGARGRVERGTSAVRFARPCTSRLRDQP
jgi:MFS transporter, FSR family, fosmidomycin resistance protein